MFQPCWFLSLFLGLMFLLPPCRHNIMVAAEARGSKWDVLHRSIGISAMHMQLMNNDKVVMYDRTDAGESSIQLPGGKCRQPDAKCRHKKIDCTAHSVEYDVATNTIRPLTLQTDVWCSSGSVFPDGSLIQTGGFNCGDTAVRVFESCVECDWREIEGGLSVTRWYATNHFLPDSRQIIIGGRRQFNYEFYPKTHGENDVYNLLFLRETFDAPVENNLYPFVFLNYDGNLFVFANNRAIMFDYKGRKVVRTYPEIPGGEPRNYPSTGSAVLLPLKDLEARVIEAQVMVCGGAPRGSYERANKKKEFIGALDTCARISINDPNPQWGVETMPMGRVMSDMIMLPNGHILLINGAAYGTAGWELGRDPVLHPVIYNPNKRFGSRFEVQNPSSIPRMYHSVAVLVRDGRVLVGGSNPHEVYKFTNDTIFPTELSLEAFSPPYLEPQFARIRPSIVKPVSYTQVTYRQRTKFRFTVLGQVDPDLVKVTMLFPPFNTHSFSMNQRLMVLDNENVTHVGKFTYEIKVTTPGSANIAPPGYYLLFVVHQDIPSEGIWMKIQ